MGGTPVNPDGTAPAAPAAPAAQGQPGTSRLAAVPDTTPKSAGEHAVDFDPLKPQGRRTTVAPRAPQGAGGGGIKAMLYFSLATNLVLIVLIVLMILFLMKMQQGRAIQPPAVGAPPAAPAAPASPAPAP
jgi:hypothetical protein